MTPVVMDASALIACLLVEPGYDITAPYLPYARVSTVNTAETVTRFARNGYTKDEITEMMAALPIQTEPLNDDIAHLIGFLEPKTRSLGLSLGDRACLALGLTLQIPVVTADRMWKNVPCPWKFSLSVKGGSKNIIEA